MHADPYAPPSSSIDGPRADHGSEGGLVYTGFWRRVGAAIIDMLLLVPIYWLEYFFGQSQMYTTYILVPTLLLGVFLHMFMVVKFGGSPGKLLLGMRVAMKDGSRVTVKGAVLRYIVYTLMGLVAGVGMIIAAHALPPESFATMDYLTRNTAMQGNLPGWAGAVNIVAVVWVIGSLISMLSTPGRRTFNDFIAGTVVVRK